MEDFATNCIIPHDSRIKIAAGRQSRMRSRDVRSRLASFAPRHPDFFNLYPPHPRHTSPSLPLGVCFLVVSGHAEAWLPRPPCRGTANFDKFSLARQADDCEGSSTNSSFIVSRKLADGASKNRATLLSPMRFSKQLANLS